MKTFSYLEYTLVSGMLLQLNQTIENNQLHVIVTLLNNQIDVALGSSLKFNTTQKFIMATVVGARTTKNSKYTK